MEVRFYHLFAVAANGRGGFHVTLVTNAQGEATNPALGEPSLALRSEPRIGFQSPYRVVQWPRIEGRPTTATKPIYSISRGSHEPSSITHIP